VKKLILATALLAAISLPSIAFAQSAPAGSLVCHPVKSGEPSNASMGSTQLACTAVNMAKVHTAMDTVHSVMMKSQASTDQMKQMQAAMSSLTQVFQLPVVPGGINNANQ
jgi:hypothetical protein